MRETLKTILALLILFTVGSQVFLVLTRKEDIDVELKEEVESLSGVTNVYINPSSNAIGTNTDFYVDIYCEPGEPMKAWEFNLSFDNTLLGVLSVENGDIFEGYNTYDVVHEMSNDTGRIVAYSLITGQGNVSEPGNFGRIYFRSLSEEGNTNFEFNSVGVTNETGYLPIQLFEEDIYIGDGNWVIEGNSVYVDDSNVYASATPHTARGDGWVVFDFVSKNYDGEIDVAWGFDTDSIQPKNAQFWKNYSYKYQKKVETWTEHWVTKTFHNITNFTNLGIENYSDYLVAYGNENNTKLYQYTQRYVDYLGGEYNEYYLNKTVAFTNLLSQDGENYTLQGNHDFFGYEFVEDWYWDWENLSLDFDKVSYSHGGMDTWYVLRNFSVTPGKNYKVRAWLDTPPGFGKISGKYWWAFKPSDESISEAITNDHFYALDPWYNTTNYFGSDYEAGVLNWNIQDVASGSDFLFKGTTGSLATNITAYMENWGAGETMAAALYSWYPGLGGDADHNPKLLSRSESTRAGGDGWYTFELVRPYPLTNNVRYVLLVCGGSPSNVKRNNQPGTHLLQTSPRTHEYPWVDEITGWAGNYSNYNISIYCSYFEPDQTAKAPSTWYDKDWDYAKKITVPPIYVEEDLYNFPMMVQINSSSDLSKAQSNGNDILFADDSGNKLYHEIEYFDRSDGDLTAWVNISTLSSSSPTEIWMYYGCTWASNQEDADNTWSTNYIAVYHMMDEFADGEDTLTDSSGNGNHGDGDNSHGGEDPVREKSERGYYMNFSNTNDVYSLPAFDYNTPFTMECWANTHNSSVGWKCNDHPVGRFWAGDILRGSTGGDGKFAGQFRINGSDFEQGAYTWGLKNHWYYGSCSADTSNATRVDWKGADLWTHYPEWESLAGEANNLNYSIYKWAIGDSAEGDGTSDSTTYDFNGSIDEVRFLKTYLTPAWKNTTFKNMWSPTNFIVLSGENFGGREWTREKAGWFTFENEQNMTQQNRGWFDFRNNFSNIDEWVYAKLITIDHDKIDDDIYNFPVYVYLNADSDLNSNAQNDGDDIVFTSYDNLTRYAHETENYTSGTLWAWVSVPYISSTTDTKFWLHYGNGTATNQEEYEKVWIYDFESVQHLNESYNTGSNHYIDSSPRDNDGTLWDAMGNCSMEESAKIYRGFNFSGNGVDCIYLDKLTQNDSITISAWYKTYDDWKENDFVLGRRYGVDSVATGTPSIRKGNLRIDGTNRYHFTNVYQNDTWYYCAVTYDGSIMRSFFNDTIDSDFRTGELDGKLYYWRIGCSGTWAKENFNEVEGPFEGVIDEVRISSVARSPAWINASFRNQNDPASFYNLGPEKGGWKQSAEGWFRFENEQNMTQNTRGFFTFENEQNFTRFVKGWFNLSNATTDFDETSYTNYRSIFIESDLINTELDNFPLLVVLDNSTGDYTFHNGYDIAFVSLDNYTQFYHEVEEFDNNDKTYCWVNISETIHPAIDYQFLVYYNNPTATGLHYNPEYVWHSDYRCVYHMNGSDLSSSIDSSLYKNDLDSANGAPLYNSSGKISTSCGADGGDRLYASDSPSMRLTSNITLEFWFYVVNWTTGYTWHPVGRYDGTDNANFYTYLDGTWDWTGQNRMAVYATAGGGWERVSPYTPPNTNFTWIHFIWSYNSTVGGSTYSNGSLVDTGVGDGLLKPAVGEAFQFFEGYDGYIDECRLIDRFINDSWANATFHTQNQTTGFLNFGPEQGGREWTQNTRGWFTFNNNQNYTQNNLGFFKFFNSLNFTQEKIGFFDFFNNQNHTQITLGWFRFENHDADFFGVRVPDSTPQGWTTLSENQVVGDKNEYILSLYDSTDRFGKVDYIRAYLKKDTDNEEAKCAVYDASGNLLGESVEVTVTSGTGQWYRFNFTDTVVLNDGTYYNLTVFGDAPGGAGDNNWVYLQLGYVYYDNVSGYDKGTYPTFEDPASFTDRDWSHLIYAHITDLEWTQNSTGYFTFGNNQNFSRYETGWFTFENNDTQMDLFGLSPIWNVTFQGNRSEATALIPDPAWCNSSGTYWETVQINVSVNATHWVDNISFYSTNLHSPINSSCIGADNISVWVSTDNITFKLLQDTRPGGKTGHFLHGGSYLYWTDATSPVGADPFEYYGGQFVIPPGYKELWVRYKVNVSIDSDKGWYENYSYFWAIDIINNSWSVDYEYFTARAQVIGLGKTWNRNTSGWFTFRNDKNYTQNSSGFFTFLNNMNCSQNTRGFFTFENGKNFTQNLKGWFNFSSLPVVWDKSDYKNYRSIFINHSYIDTQLENFPVLVVLDNSSGNFTFHNGYDIAFVNLANDTQFNHEVEFFNNSGETFVWVNISETMYPEIDYQFLVYYNNSDATGLHYQPTYVWDDHYRMVLHMNETEGTQVNDSTNYQHTLDIQTNGTTVNLDAVGMISGCDDFDTLGRHQIADTNSLDLDFGTVECWYNADVNKAWFGLIHKGDLGSFADESYSLQGRGDGASDRLCGYLKGEPADKTLYQPTPQNISTNMWYYACLAWNDTGTILYENNSIEDTDTGITVDNTNGALNIGIQTTNSDKFGYDGRIDEVRLSDIRRNASWINASYFNQKQEVEFVTFGPEKDVGWKRNVSGWFTFFNDMNWSYNRKGWFTFLNNKNFTQNMKGWFTFFNNKNFTQNNRGYFTFWNNMNMTQRTLGWFTFNNNLNFTRNNAGWFTLFNNRNFSIEKTGFFLFNNEMNFSQSKRGFCLFNNNMNFTLDKTGFFLFNNNQNFTSNSTGWFTFFNNLNWSYRISAGWYNFSNGTGLHVWFTYEEQGSTVICHGHYRGLLEQFAWNVTATDGTEVGTTGWTNYTGQNLVYTLSSPTPVEYEVIFVGRNFRKNDNQTRHVVIDVVPAQAEPDEPEYVPDDSLPSVSPGYYDINIGGMRIDARILVLFVAVVIFILYMGLRKKKGKMKVFSKKDLKITYEEEDE